MNKRNLIGEKFGRWTVIGKADIRNGMTVWKCRCECGTEKEVYQKHLLSGASASCGCLAKEKARERIELYRKDNATHRMTGTRLYHIWINIKSRCYNDKNNNHSNYGGRGITICDEWQDFDNFMKWAINNGYTDTLTIERIDVNGNYEPSNCKWTTMKEQGNNRRNNHFITYKGITRTISQWSEMVGINRSTLYARINRDKWSIGRALGYE